MTALRLAVSASRPATRPSKSIGAMPKKPTSATSHGESVNWSTSQPSTVICIHREL